MSEPRRPSPPRLRSIPRRWSSRSGPGTDHLPLTRIAEICRRQGHSRPGPLRVDPPRRFRRESDIDLLWITGPTPAEIIRRGFASETSSGSSAAGRRRRSKGRASPNYIRRRTSSRPRSHLCRRMRACCWIAPGLARDQDTCRERPGGFRSDVSGPRRPAILTSSRAASQSPRIRSAPRHPLASHDRPAQHPDPRLRKVDLDKVWTRSKASRP
jgi:hypothetical protein